MNGPAARPIVGQELLLHMGFLVLIQVIWGVGWVFGKLALIDFPPMMMMALRFGVLAVVFLPFMRWHPGKFRQIVIIALFGGALSFGLGFLAMTMAHDIAPLAIAANLGVPFATILSAIFLGDRIRIWRGSALVIAFAGILVASFDPRLFDDLPGVAFSALSAFFWAVGTIMTRRLTGVGALDLQGWVSVCAFPPLLAASLLFEPGSLGSIPHASWLGWASLFYIIIGSSIIGHVGVTWLVQRHPFSLLGPYMLLAPIIGAISGVLYLGDQISWRVVLGGALTLLGVLVITLRESRRKVPVPPPVAVEKPLE